MKKMKILKISSQIFVRTFFLIKNGILRLKEILQIFTIHLSE